MSSYYRHNDLATITYEPYLENGAFYNRGTRTLTISNWQSAYNYVKAQWRRIPHCTREQLLYWILEALGRTETEEFRNNAEELRRRCKRRAAAGGLGLCCGVMFLLVILGTIAGVTAVAVVAGGGGGRAGAAETPPPPFIPGDYNFTCGADTFFGELEDTQVSNYTITGHGCNNLPITVTTSQGPITASKRKNAKLEKRGGVEVDYDVVVVYTSNKTVGFHPHINTNISGHVMTRDIGAFPNPYMEEILELTFVPGTKKRAIITGDAGGLFYTGGEQYLSGDNSNLFGITTLSYYSGQLYFIAYNVDPTFATAIVSFYPGFSSCADVMFPIVFVNTDNSIGVNIKFDWEANRFVISAIGGDAFCLIISDTDDPSGTWSELVFVNSTFNSYQSAFEFSIWGDYYNACWLNNTERTQHCVIIDRNTSLALGNPPLAFVMKPIFNLPNTSFPNIPAVHPLHQGLSSRGQSVLNFPCGIFSIANDQMQQFQSTRCVSVNFETGIATLSSNSMNVAGGWDSGYSVPCNGIVHGGCIPNAEFPEILLEPLPNRLRMAYYNYVTHEKFAYVWQKGLGTGLLWGELESLEGSSDISPGTIDAVPNVTFYFAPNLIYDCRETLFMTFTQSAWETKITQCYTYHLRTDPENQIRNPPDKVPSVFTSRPVTTTWPMPSAIADTNVPRRRRFFISNVEFQSLYNARLLDQDFELTYIATDACGRNFSCSQQVHLGTIANCTN